MSFIFFTNRHILINRECLNRTSQTDFGSGVVAPVLMIKWVDKWRLLSGTLSKIQGELFKTATPFRISFVM